MAASGRIRNPRGQGANLRASLMDAARELLLELGDQDKLSVRGVTARAGVSPNALYMHFAGKNELLSAVMLAGYGELRAFLHASVPVDGEPLEQLRALARGYLAFASERPGIYRVLFMTKIRDGVPVPTRNVTPGLDEGVDTFNDLLEIVARCLPDGQDAFTQASYIWAGLHGFASLRQVIPSFPWPSPAEYVERMVDVHVRLGAAS